MKTYPVGRDYNSLRIRHGWAMYSILDSVTIQQTQYHQP